MIFRPIFIVLLLLNFCCTINAQSILRGKIYEAENDSATGVVNVYNLHSKQSARSGIDGNYTIAAAEGERIIFSMAGFRPDTVTVAYSMLLTQYDVTMHRQVILLKPVSVISSYQADSLARRNYYSYVYEKQAGITGRNRPADGVGVVLSPLSFFSHEARQKRQLKKRLIKEEQEDYIDRSFPAEWVERLTLLHGDSLSLFMYRYRPTYSFCRKTNREKMLLYINEKLKEFKKSDTQHGIH
jgi:hypothetical protein